MSAGPNSAQRARELLSRGLWLFPLKGTTPEGANTPLHKEDEDAKKPGWQDVATTDEAKVLGWIKRGHGIGVFTSRFGDDKALLVVDVDMKKGKNGDAEVLKLEMDGFEFPVTFTQRTPSGGRHLVYWTDKPVKQGIDVFGDGPGIDIRSDGGYFVAAGTVRLEAGEVSEYEVINAAPIAEASAWMVEKCGMRAAKSPNAGALVHPNLASPEEQDRVQGAAVEYIRGLPPVLDGGRNTAVYQMACAVKDMGVWPWEAAMSIIEEHADIVPPLDSSELEATVHSAYKSGQNPVGSADAKYAFLSAKPVDGAEVAPAMTDDGRAVVRYEPEHLADAGQLIQRAMLDDTAHEPLLTYEGRYVSIRHSQAVTAIQRLRGAKGRAFIHAHDNESLRARIMESAKVYSWKSAGGKGAWSPVRCPDDLVSHLQSSAKRNVPGLTGIITAPTILPDGSDIWTAGYHDASGLYADFDPAEFPGIDAIPTQKDAAAARAWLRRELFGEVAFRDETDADVAIAALITGCVRRFLGAAPAFLYVSAMPGSGKSTLMFSISTAVSGGAEPRTWPKNDEEMNKTLLTVLQKNALTINFDNLARGTAIAKESSLAAVLTSESYSGRLLGGNSDALLPASILVQITGNNVRLQDDMPSRIIPCRLDPRMENPAARKFKRNLLDWTAQNRGAIVRAALTIVAAYLRNGKPEVSGDVSRFQDWDKMVRKPLMYAGGSNVVLAMLAAAEDDDVKNELSEVMAAWWSLFGDKGMKAGELDKAVTSDFSNPTATGCLRQWFTGEVSRPLTPALIGRRIADVIDQRVRGKAFARDLDKKDGGHSYRLVQVEQRPGG